jgi:hypothetical protein
MNIGIYIDSMSDKNILESISEFVKNKDSSISDISIFFNTVDFNPYTINCGFFNASELWSFSGNLIVTSLDCLATANKVVNDISLFYYFGLENEYNIFKLIEHSKSNNIICKSDKDKQELFRITGQNTIGVCENLETAIQTILRCKNGHKKNTKSIYRT